MMIRLGRLCFFLAAVCVFVLCACEAGQTSTTTPLESSQFSRERRVGLALGVFGLGDQSFNDQQYSGLVQAYLKLPIQAGFRVPESNSRADLEKLFRDLIEVDRSELVIVAEAYAMGEVVKEFALRHPEVVFVLMESEAVGLSNVVATEFAQNEGSFLAGVLAARVSRSRRFGFIGGVDLLPLKDFLIGFEAGVKYVDPEAEVALSWISESPDFSGFNDPRAGYRIALEMYSNDCEIVYSVAGGSGTGIIQAARDAGKLAIGVDSDQDHLAPGRVLTSMLKRSDVAVTNIIGRFLSGRLEGGRIYRFDLENFGVGLTDFEYTRDLVSSDLQNELEDLIGRVGRGELEIPTALR